MHPAFSVIFFTVTSGAGYGLVALLAIMNLFGIDGGFTATETIIGVIASIIMVTLGLMSSTLHLASPENAWRAFFRFKTSWLSREGVFAVVFYPFAIGYLAATYYGWASLTELFAWATLALALITIFSTSMIYACLKTIRAWNTSLTPVNYIMLGLMIGAYALVAVRAYAGESTAFTTSLAFWLTGLAALTKAIYFFWIDRTGGPTINTATGFTRDTVRILDTGHTAGTFLTDEFGYFVEREKIIWLRGTMYVLGFILPVAVLFSALGGSIAIEHAIGAAFIAFVGIMVERWLFFAEARHVINLYHGLQRT